MDAAEMPTVTIRRMQPNSVVAAPVLVMMGGERVQIALGPKHRVKPNIYGHGGTPVRFVDSGKILRIDTGGLLSEADYNSLDVKPDFDTRNGARRLRELASKCGIRIAPLDAIKQWKKMSKLAQEVFLDFYYYDYFETNREIRLKHERSNSPKSGSKR